MTADVEVLGIRHHGPGSARSVAGALADLAPDQVIIEGPPELDSLLPLAGDPDLVPPVAALVYATDEPSRAAFYPFAVFSPEWVAMRWALRHNVAVRFADLPASNRLALRARRDDDGPDGEDGQHGPDGQAVGDASDDQDHDQGDGGDHDRDDHDGDRDGDDHDGDDREPTAVRLRQDPVAHLAAAAGYDDPERWWEDAVEHRSSSTLERFRLLREALAAIRADHPEVADDDILRREAAMRRVIRTAIKDGRQRIAVVCGAAHAPALHPDAFGSIAADNRLLARLPRIKVTATWAPWTSGRLAVASGYGAGVDSPGWYQHLFRCWEEDRAEDVVPGWLTRVARTLRDEGLDAAPATVVEAVRLAEALAAVRGRPSVGLAELTDATQAVLCEGSAVPLRLIERTLVVGEELGRVPDSAPLVPLAQDLARLQRRLRLKPSAGETVITLDLRRDSQRQRSLLLHRLALLGIGWGRPADAGGSTGTFKEAWVLQWHPEFAVALVEAGLYGTTVLEAAENYLMEQARQADDLARLGTLTEQALTADLPRALAVVIEALAAQTAHQHDTLALLRSIEPLARTQRYGDVRQADTRIVAEVLATVVTRAAIGLRPATVSLDDAAADTMRAALDAAHRGIALTHVGADTWRQALQQVAADDRVHGLVCGRVNRILLDAGTVDRDTVAARLSRRLSVGTPPAAGAAWLDGFLEGDALLLLHDDDLLRLIDDWVDRIDDDTFDDLVPLLRRTFARFDPAVRRQLANRVRTIDGPAGAALATGVRLDLDQARPVVARVAELLGLEAS